jgi:hypothetical protein
MTGGPDGNPIKTRRWSPSKDGDSHVTHESDHLGEDGNRDDATAATVATWVKRKSHQQFHIVRLT